MHELLGRIKKVDWGKWNPSEVSSVKLTMTLRHYEQEVADETVLNIDIENMMPMIDGVDQMTKMRRALALKACRASKTETGAMCEKPPLDGAGNVIAETVGFPEGSACCAQSRLPGRGRSRSRRGSPVRSTSGCAGSTPEN